MSVKNKNFYEANIFIVACGSEYVRGNNFTQLLLKNNPKIFQFS